MGENCKGAACRRNVTIYVFMLKKQLLIHKIYFYGDNSWQSLPLFPLLTRKEGSGEISLPDGTQHSGRRSRGSEYQ